MIDSNAPVAAFLLGLVVLDAPDVSLPKDIQNYVLQDGHRMQRYTNLSLSAIGVALSINEEYKGGLSERGLLIA